MKRLIVPKLFLFLLACEQVLPQVVVHIGPVAERRGNSDTEVRLASVCIYKTRWSLKEGRTEKKETSITLIIMRQSPDIIGLNLDKSEIKSFTDDMGTNLLVPENKTPDNKPNIEVFTSMTYSQALNLRIFGLRLPHPGSHKLRIEGNLTLNIGTSRTTIDNNNVSLKEGNEINAGPLMLKITKVGSADPNKHPWAKDHNAIAVTFECEADRKPIQDMQFTDINGNYINVSMMSSSYDAERKRSVLEYIIMNTLDKYNIKVSYWAGTEEIAIPFKFETGLDAEEVEIK